MILSRFEDIKFTCEFKYDGLRGQIHYNHGQVSVYSRNLENMTETYPDIISVVKNYVQLHEEKGIESFIMDSEIVAYETSTNRILPF
jgi:DNA ligase-1